LRLSTRKTGKAIVLPLAASLRKQIECLLTSSNEPSAPVHPKAFDLVERQRKTGNLSNQFAGLLAAAGLRQKKNHKSTGKGRGKRRNVETLSFHSLRRTATTFLHEAGLPSAVAQAQIGHDGEAMHELYIGGGQTVSVWFRALSFAQSRGSFLGSLVLSLSSSVKFSALFLRVLAGHQVKGSAWQTL
jgi:integrase